MGFNARFPPGYQHLFQNVNSCPSETNMNIHDFKCKIFHRGHSMKGMNQWPFSGPARPDLDPGSKAEFSPALTDFEWLVFHSGSAADAADIGSFVIFGCNCPAQLLPGA